MRWVWKTASKALAARFSAVLRSGAEAGDVRGQGVDLVLVEAGVLDLDLGAGLGHRHPAGADLEVDGGGTDTDQGGAVELPVLGGDALTVGAVAGGAVDHEELFALGDESSVVLLLLGLGGRGERGVRAAGAQQGDQEHGGTGQRAATVPRQSTDGAVQ